MNRMDTAEDLQQIARFNSEIMTQEEMKQIYSQKNNEIKELKKEIYEFDPLTGGLSEKKKLDVANKKLLDFYQTMTEDQQQTLTFKKNCEDASPIDHQDIIAWMTQLLKERDEFEEENEELKVRNRKLERAVEKALLVCDGSWSVFSSDEEDE